mmetsp:Transcript_24084/g.78436  ORF Transcript_24084/g.78436 Transcript_24084/m.78436 type:complete len:1325 (-) Transcript_24084:21-3995(-)
MALRRGWSLRALLFVCSLAAATPRGASVGASDDCYCGGWHSTNTAGSLLQFSEPAWPGVGYRGFKNTSASGAACVPWSEAVRRCASSQPERFGEFYHMEPDKLSRGRFPRAGLFSVDADEVGEGENAYETFNRCRSPPTSTLVFDEFRNQNAQLGSFESAHAQGPWCFVDVSDPLVDPDAPEPGNDSAYPGVPFVCEGLRRASCGIPPCPPPRACLRQQSNGTLQQQQPLKRSPVLLANANLDEWRPSHTFKDFASPVDHTHFVHWKISVRTGTWGASGDKFEWELPEIAEEQEPFSGYPFPYDTYVLPWPFIDEWTFAAVEPVSPGRGDEGSAALMRIDQLGRTAMIKSHPTTTASLEGGTAYAVRVWAKCGSPGKRSALYLSMVTFPVLPTPGLNASMPGAIRSPIVWELFKFRGLRLMPAQLLVEDNDDGGGARLEEAVDGGGQPLPAWGSNSTLTMCADDATEDEWQKLEVLFRPTRTSRDVEIQLHMEAYESGAEVIVDDFALELIEEEEEEAEDEDEGSCSEWQCADEPIEMFYRLKEEAGVPVNVEQVHSMVRVAVNAVECRQPDAEEAMIFDETSCGFLTNLKLPHLTGDGVRAHLDSFGDAQLAEFMGWDDPSLLYAGSEPLRAVAILRELLPRAVEAGVIRVLSGNAYGYRFAPEHLFTFDSDPITTVSWLTAASTGSGNGIAWYQAGVDGVNSGERNCSFGRPWRSWSCFMLAEMAAVIGCTPKSVAGTLDPDGTEMIRADGMVIINTGAMSQMSGDPVLGAALLATRAIVGNGYACTETRTQLNTELGGQECSVPLSTLRLAFLMPTLDAAMQTIDGMECMRDMNDFNLTDPNIWPFITTLQLPDFGGGETTPPQSMLPPPPPIDDGDEGSGTPPGEEEDEEDTEEEEGDGRGNVRRRLAILIGLSTGAFVLGVVAFGVFAMRLRREQAQRKIKKDYAARQDKDGVPHDLVEIDMQRTNSPPQSEGSSAVTATSSVQGEQPLINGRMSSGSTPQRLQNAAAADFKQVGLPLVHASELVCDYTHSHMIGRGTFGVCYRGFYRGQPVAIKRMRLVRETSNAGFMSPSFLEECRLLSKLSESRNIVNVIGMSQIDCDLLLIMELCDCGTLRSFIGSKGPGIDVPQAVSFIRDIAMGLKYMHSLKVAHRDLKSENVLIMSVSPGGEGDAPSYVAKLADLGTSKEFVAETADNPSRIGTLLWMAPELISASDTNPVPAFDQRMADLYSLGIVAWELLHRLNQGYAALPLPEGLTSKEKLQALPPSVAQMHAKEFIVAGRRPPLPDSWEPRNVVNLVRKLWSPDKEARPTVDQVFSLL